MHCCSRNTFNNQLKSVFYTPECSPVTSEPDDEDKFTKKMPLSEIEPTQPLDLSSSKQTTSRKIEETPLSIEESASFLNNSTYPIPIDFRRPTLDHYMVSSEPPQYRGHSPSTPERYVTQSPKSNSAEIIRNPSPTSTSSQQPEENILHYNQTRLSNPSLKLTRPFKAYPKDPIVMTTGARTFAEACIQQESISSYMQFRENVFKQVHSPSSVVSNPKMRRNSKNSENTEGKDQAYWERRRKNNEAAKRSRDARRAKEDEIAIRAAFLEQENQRLTSECASLQIQLAELKAKVSQN